MSVIKQHQQAVKAVSHQKQMLSEFESLARSIERCERTITELKEDLQAINLKHQNRKTTQDDIAYLTDLLKCANRKLGWEKQIASLKKRTPALLEQMLALLNDPNNPPQAEMRVAMLNTLQTVQLALERLEKAKVD